MEKIIVVVTGANKGIGYEIVAELLRDTDYVVVSCSRDAARGKASVEKLAATFPEKKDNVVLETLDVSEKDSIYGFVERMTAKFGKVDVVIHNAAFATYDSKGVAENARKTFDANYFGLFTLQDQLMPLLGKSRQPRVIIMTSTVGQMTFEQCTKGIQEKFRSFTGVKEVDATAEEFISLAEENGDKAASVLEDKGYANVDFGGGKCMNYCWTKVFVNARVKVMRNLPEYKLMLLEMVCPGYCATDLNNYAGYRTAQKGAETPAWLAIENFETLKKKEGQFFWFDKGQLPYFA